MTFLTDRQWKEHLAAGRLIRSGTFDLENVRHASYMLRLSTKVHVARKGAYSASGHREYKIEYLTAESPLRLHPGDAAYLYSIEELDIPDKFVGFTVARGLLFSESLSPENTYVDPGFGGSLYIVVTNVSEGIVTLSPGISIARLFVAVLEDSVEVPYTSGTSLGIPQTIPSGLAVNEPDERGLQKMSARDLLSWCEEHRAVPTVVAEMHRRTLTAQARMIIALFVWPILLVVANSEPLRSHLSPIVSSIAAGLVTSAIWVGTPRLLRKMSV